MIHAALALALFLPAQSLGDDHPVNRWMMQSPREGAPVPGLGWEGSGVWDSSRGRWIHHAGHDGIPQGFVLFDLDLRTGTWKQHFPPTSPPGVCCVDGSNTFDHANNVLVRFPGGSLGHGWQFSRGVRLKDSHAWVYDPATTSWTNMRPEPYAAAKKYSKDVVGGLCAGAAFDPVHQVALSFGGAGSGGKKNALFAYDAYANAFTRVKAENPPPPRDGMGLAYDSRHGALVMYGSQYLSDGRTWTFDFKTGAWTEHEISPRPPFEKGKTYSTIPKMAYDSRNGVLLCLIWRGEKDGHETWTFDLGERKWTRRNPAEEPAPSKSRSRNLAYSEELNLFVLETTAVSGGPQVWTYRAGNADPVRRPRGLRVVTGNATAKLTWKGGGKADVYRAPNALPWKLRYEKIGTGSGSFEDTGLKPGEVYSYVVEKEGVRSFRARTQPRVLLRPVVSVLSGKKVDVRWNAHPAEDVAGYNLYRGVVSVRTVTKGEPKAWRDNDPQYDSPRIVGVGDITGIRRINDALLTSTVFEDGVDLAARESGNYERPVYAYIVRAVNRLGTESGPSPYALTIPSEPESVLCREKGRTAELKWNAAREKAVRGYHVYRLQGGSFGIVRLTKEPVKEPAFSQEGVKGATRYWVTTVDALGQEGQPSSPAWFGRSYKGFFEGEWHQ